MGRPREFERDVVLDRAMRVFWTRGYEATSVQHLVARMGIQRGSLYDTFGDKRGLFFAAIDHYDRVVTAKLLAALEEASGKDAIRRFFRLKIELALEPGRPRGCLVTNSAAELASRDRGTASRVGSVLAKIEAGFHRAVVRAQKAGEIDRSRNPRALARFLTSSAQGLSVMAKTFPDRAVLEDIVKVILAALQWFYKLEPEVERPATLDHLVMAVAGWLTGNMGSALDARGIKSSPDNLVAHVEGIIAEFEEV